MKNLQQLTLILLWGRDLEILTKEKEKKIPHTKGEQKPVEQLWLSSLRLGGGGGGVLVQHVSP